MRVAKYAILTLFVAAIISAVTLFPQRLCFKGGKGYTFYCGTSSADCREVTVESNVTLKKLQLSQVCGEATVYEIFDLDAFLKKVDGKIIAVEELSDSVNYYCTANLPYSVNLYGTRINLHVSIRNGSAKVGSPIIFGGY